LINTLAEGCAQNAKEGAISANVWVHNALRREWKDYCVNMQLKGEWTNDRYIVY
jgi:hypothetical protein